MKKKKMTADNVEQLMEIVRAIQQGEEPDEALRRKQAESAPEADSPKSRPAKRKAADEQKESRSGEAAERKKRTQSEGAEEWDSSSDTAGTVSGKEVYPEEDGFEDDEFERILDEDDLESADFRAACGRVWGRLTKAAGALRSKIKARPAEGQETPAREEEAEPDRKSQDAPAGEPEEEAPAAGIRKESQAGQEVSSAEKRVRRRAAQEIATAEAVEKMVESQAEEKPEEQTAGADQDGLAETGEQDAPPEKTEDERTIERLLDRDDLNAATAREADGKKQPADDAKRGVRRGPGGLWEYFSELRGNLQQKGIRRRELFMIGVGAVLIIMIIALIVNWVSGAVAAKKKQENVVADAGLTVLVEKEPQQWCSSYPVELRFQVRGGTITQVKIDGTEYEPDDAGRVTVETGNYLLQASVTTEEGTLQAQIEIPKLDAQPPVVSVARVKEQITVTAVDARSEVAGIYYAAVHGSDYMQLPYYQKYDTALTYEEDTVYYFYAQDAAGNRSTPVVTTTETAQELTLAQEKISLFPGETAYLELHEEPDGALLNNLVFESANQEVATVSSTGAVTGVGEGSTIVKVSADGVGQAACEIEVSDTRTVTISAIGDCTLGTDESFNTTTNFDAFYAVNGQSYFFDNVREILENDDATFANLEGTLTTETARESKEYAFKGDPSYTGILQDGSIDVVTLANNHSSDYGEQSLADTKKYLDEAGIDYCTGDTIVLKEVNGIETAFIGIYVLADGIGKESQVRETIAAAQNQGAQLIVVAFHWGTEKVTEPDETQKSLAHTAIDCGANLVVGHHPHVLSGIEKYNGRYIVYSLGNFCFGGNSAPSDSDTIIFRQTFSVSESGVAADDEIEVIPCKISSAEGYNNYQPTPAEGTEAERIIGRVNEYSEAFGQTFSASDGLNG